MCETQTCHHNQIWLRVRRFVEKVFYPTTLSNKLQYWKRSYKSISYKKTEYYSFIKIRNNTWHHKPQLDMWFLYKKTFYINNYTENKLIKPPATTNICIFITQSSKPSFCSFSPGSQISKPWNKLFSIPTFIVSSFKSQAWHTSYGMLNIWPNPCETLILLNQIKGYYLL